MSPSEITHEYLVQWLLDNGYAEERAGFGHVSADILSEALLSHFIMTIRPVGYRDE